MANLQELMQLVLERRAHSPAVALYSAWVTPIGGVARHVSIRSTLGAARVRLMVQRVAARKFPQGFSFSVRPQ